MSTDAAGLLSAYQERLGTALDRSLPSADRFPARLHEAMRYASRGGKRLRAMLVYATGDVLALEAARLDSAAVAIELIHAYSLVHDDLPAMDDDDLRRGQPTVHKAYDEATAILVGDALQTHAFQVLAQDSSGLSATQRLAMISLLARASGAAGMCGGQAIDLESVGKQLSLAEVEAMHIMKTGALIRASLLLACAAAESLDAEDHERLDHLGKCLGLAFQIQDDVLDVEGLTEELGKRSGADQARNKPTFTAVLGLPAAKQRASELFSEARQTLAPFGDRGAGLLALIDRIEGRRH